MSLRKMCALLAVLSAITAAGGIWWLVKAGDAAGNDPVELASLEAGDLADGKAVTFATDKVMSYVCYIAETEDGANGHRYRYYPVQYRSNPARFVLVCVPNEKLAEFEDYNIGKKTGSLTVKGYLRTQEPRTKAAVDELVLAMDGLDEGDAGYADRFLPYYVEIATLSDSALMRTAGWVLLVGGLVLLSVGIAGVVLFRNYAEEEDTDTAAEESPEHGQ